MNLNDARRALLKFVEPAALLLLTLLVCPRHVPAATVLLVSVDGMKPEYVTQAESHGLKVPFLRGLMQSGTFASGVTGVYPTITYPSHTTLLTGVTPAEHGIVANLEFDPRHKFADAWFWYAAQIHAPTLWGAAHAKGLVTASVGWPVSVGAGDVDYLIPEYWRVFSPAADLNPSDRHLMAALTRPVGLLEEIGRTQGPYLQGNDVSLAGDAIKTRFAVDILNKHKPGFMTVHLSSLDEAEHDHGPFSPEADTTLEAIDGLLAQLAAAVRTYDPAAVVMVVSDHGFVPVHHRVNLYVPFIEAGLLDPSGAWKAQPWLAGGMAAVMLKEPRDATTAAAVTRLLDKLKADPANGIAQIMTHEEARARGAFPDAMAVIVLEPGFYAGANRTGALLTAMEGSHGGHGFSPATAEMRSAFFAAGSGIAAHRDLGLIDMRQIAPTVAGLLDVALPSATAPALPIHP